MRFQVTEEIGRARCGVIRVRGHNYSTPVLWLGDLATRESPMRRRFSPRAIMVNAAEILGSPAARSSTMSEGIHDYLAYEGLVMMDSGGYQRRGGKSPPISLDSLQQFYEAANPDIAVTLDFPTNPLLSARENRRRIRLTSDNARWMAENNGHLDLMPVVHGCSIRQIQRSCDVISRVCSPEIVGIGGMVPFLFHTKAASALKDSRKFIVDAISTVRSAFPEALLHMFGVGGTASMHFAFWLGVDSVDSMGWRLKATYGRILLPGVPDRYLRPRPNGRRVLSEQEEELLGRCRCPACGALSLQERRNFLDASFKARATHNSWVFREEERAFHRALERGSTTSFVRGRVRGSKLATCFSAARAAMET